MIIKKNKNIFLKKLRDTVFDEISLLHLFYIVKYHFIKVKFLIYNHFFVFNLISFLLYNSFFFFY